MLSREELLHPLLAHFPIAILVLSAVFRWLSLFCIAESKKKWKDFFFLNSQIFLIGGIVFLGITFFTGDIAVEKVKSSLDDITVLYDHEDSSYRTLYIFLGILFLDFILFFKSSRLKISIRQERWFQRCIGILFLIGCISLVESVHYGALLVYDQGAGVKIKK